MLATLPSLRTSVPGPRSLALWAREEAIIAPGLQSVTQWARVSFSHGQGAVLWDVDGNGIIDFMAGIGVCSIGHAHPAHASAVAQQAARLAAGSFTSEARVELLEELRSILPEHLTRIQFYSGGAEAVEAALRLARCATGKSTVVGFWGGYHGKTEGTRPSRKVSSPATACRRPGRTRCPTPIHTAMCSVRTPTACVKARASCASQSNTARTARLPRSSSSLYRVVAGNVVPPPGFLAEVQKVARDVGALLIVDEMITGFYRTGKPFGFMHDEGVEPDIVVMGKGFGNGYPISGVAARESVARSQPWAKPSGNSSSYGGNALACAAALATLRVMRHESLGEHAASVGDFMLERLRDIASRAPIIGDVRGKGLLLGVELVRDRQSKEGLSREQMRGIFGDILGRGVLVMPSGTALRINPPLVISQGRSRGRAGRY